MPTLKPIETSYKGYLFRSRLEARWAVYFDALSLSWDYEPEGFDLDGVWYLPDFLVKTPQGEDMWVEVKPEGVTSDEKFERFYKALNPDRYSITTRVYLVSGTPHKVLTGCDVCPRCGAIEPKLLYDTATSCFHCDMETPSGGGHPTSNDGLCGIEYRPHKGLILLEDGNFYRHRCNLQTAATKAQQARFEHGASGSR
jgi:hypothetical protein